MNRLADVELQLIMHGLVAAELLQLARCSRRLLHAADCALAWQHTQARLTFHFPRRPAPSRWSSWMKSGRKLLLGGKSPPPSSLSLPLQVAASPRLLRHSRTILQLRSSHSGHVSSEDVRALCELLARLPACIQLHELDWGVHTNLSADSAHLLLTLPALQFLRVTVAGQSRLVDESVRLLSRLQLLHTLECRCDYGSNGMDSLSAFPALTSLQINDNCPQSCLYAIARCSQLTHLHLLRPRLDGARLRAFFGSPLMQRNLQWLRIDGLSVRHDGLDEDKSVSDADYIAAFSSLSALHTLRLHRVFNIDHLLLHLSYAPALRLCELHLDVYRHASDCIPSPPAVTRFLTAAPESQLHVKLDAAEDRSDSNDFYLAIIRRHFSELLSGDGDRDRDGGSSIIAPPEPEPPLLAAALPPSLLCRFHIGFFFLRANTPTANIGRHRQD